MGWSELAGAVYIAEQSKMLKCITFRVRVSAYNFNFPFVRATNCFFYAEQLYGIWCHPYLFICRLQKWNPSYYKHYTSGRDGHSLSNLTHLLHPVLWCVSWRLDRAPKFDSLIEENIYSTHTHRKRRVSTTHTKARFWRGSERKSKGCLPPTDTGCRSGRLSRRRGGGCESQNLFNSLGKSLSLLA